MRVNGLWAHYKSDNVRKALANAPSVVLALYFKLVVYLLFGITVRQNLAGDIAC